MNAIELNELSKKVAALLNLQAVEVNEQIRIFTGSETYFIICDRDYRHTRLEIHGNFHFTAVQKQGEPRCEWFGPANSFSPTISVAADRTPEAIAKDITRRFLPKYETEGNAALAKRNQQDAYFTGKAALLAEVKAALGTDGNYPLNVETSQDSVTFTCHNLNREQALELANFLRISGISIHN